MKVHELLTFVWTLEEATPIGRLEANNIIKYYSEEALRITLITQPTKNSPPNNNLKN